VDARARERLADDLPRGRPQYIVIAVSGAITREYIAFSLPESGVRHWRSR